MTFEQFLEKRDEICAEAQGWTIDESACTPFRHEPVFVNDDYQFVSRCLSSFDYSKPDNWASLREEAIKKNRGGYDNALIRLTSAQEQLVGGTNPLHTHTARLSCATPDQMCYAAVMVLLRCWRPRVPDWAGWLTGAYIALVVFWWGFWWEKAEDDQQKQTVATMSIIWPLTLLFYLGLHVSEKYRK